jgi:RHH-type proline utilization regulon transcriptional repressor/proline dehydrogenase/delta 1-pyrroline-5-carboxylate dehydrogenase
MAELRLGNPDRLSTDIGPVIDAEARESIEAHVQRMAALGRRVFRPPQRWRRCRACRDTSWRRR